MIAAFNNSVCQHRELSQHDGYAVCPECGSEFQWIGESPSSRFDQQTIDEASELAGLDAHYAALRQDAAHEAADADFGSSVSYDRPDEPEPDPEPIYALPADYQDPYAFDDPYAHEPAYGPVDDTSDIGVAE